MLLKEISPFVRQAIMGSISSRTPNDVFFKLRTPDHRLYCIIAGKGDMVIEDKKSPLSSGSVILFQAGTEYTWYPAENELLDFIAINFDYTRSFSHITRTFHPIHSNVFSEEDIIESAVFTDTPILNSPVVLHDSTIRESQFRQLVTEYSIGGEYSEELLSSILRSIIISIVRDHDTNKSTAITSGLFLAKAIMRYIQKNYRKPISYDTLAERFHMNSIYLNRVFKKNCGTSIHAFIINYRINTAMDLLRSSNIPVNEISLMVGFSDYPHFLKTFKKITGQTPANYRTSI